MIYFLLILNLLSSIELLAQTDDSIEIGPERGMAKGILDRWTPDGIMPVEQNQKTSIPFDQIPIEIGAMRGGLDPKKLENMDWSSCRRAFDS